MAATAVVTIDSSQFPSAIRRDLLDSLRQRKVNHKFHYDSLKQTQKWLAVHEAYSPFRKDPDCEAVYRRSFAAVSALLGAVSVHLVGLGCGGGKKDTELLRQLQALGGAISYTPCDVSVAMVLVATQTVLQVFPELDCSPLVCDLATTEDLVGLVDSGSSTPPGRGRSPARLFTFFGMLPNFEPDVLLPRLSRLLTPSDHLLLSANLAPGPDYAAGVQRVLPLYDNPPTRDWLMTFLTDLGVDASDGRLDFVIEEQSVPPSLRRIAAYFKFTTKRTIALDAHRIEFNAGDSVRLFFSYRHTPGLMRSILSQHGLVVVDQWIARSDEEGVYLVKKSQ